MRVTDQTDPQIRNKWPAKERAPPVFEGLEAEKKPWRRIDELWRRCLRAYGR